MADISAFGHPSEGFRHDSSMAVPAWTPSWLLRLSARVGLRNGVISGRNSIKSGPSFARSCQAGMGVGISVGRVKRNCWWSRMMMRLVMQQLSPSH